MRGIGFKNHLGEQRIDRHHRAVAPHLHLRAGRDGHQGIVIGAIQAALSGHLLVELQTIAVDGNQMARAALRALEGEVECHIFVVSELAAPHSHHGVLQIIVESDLVIQRRGRVDFVFGIHSAVAAGLLNRLAYAGENFICLERHRLRERRQKQQRPEDNRAAPKPCSERFAAVLWFPAKDGCVNKHPRAHQ